MKLKLYIFLVIFQFLMGFIVGCLWPRNNDFVWDINKDSRGCLITWDDGTYSLKSPIYNLGTIEPGESKEVGLLDWGINNVE